MFTLWLKNEKPESFFFLDLEGPEHLLKQVRTLGLLTVSEPQTGRMQWLFQTSGVSAITRISF